MSGSSPTPPSPEVDRRQLEIAAALAAERLMEVHFRYAMELVEHAREQVDASRALEIYARLHGIRQPDAERLRHRVLVALGRRADARRTGGSGEELAVPDTPRSVIGVIKKRLRGRVHLALREWVEFHTGRAETELLWAHVENALQFVDLMAPAADVADAVAAYAGHLGIPSARTEIIYYLTLAHLSGNPLVSPAHDSIADVGRPALRIGSSRGTTGRRNAS
jgi:hypothetical protein